MRIGLNERHGVAIEQSLNPPRGIEYVFMNPSNTQPWFISSRVKGFMLTYDDMDVDLIEATNLPVCTRMPWVYSLARFSEAAAFNIRGIEIPRSARVAYLLHLFRRDNFRRMIFWSQAGLESIERYGRVRDRSVLDKCEVVYPSVTMPSESRPPSDQAPQLLFSGDFFRKGGVHVVEAFERLLEKYPEATLWLCCDIDRDFNVGDAALKAEFTSRVATNPQIRVGRVERSTLLRDIMPLIDVYLLPTYAESFGYAVLEAMAHGIPVLATNHFAIPEMVDDGKTGYLIDLPDKESQSVCRGYVVNSLPELFRRHMSNMVYERLSELCGSSERRTAMGRAARKKIERRFSHKARHEVLQPIYEAAVRPTG